MASYNPGDSLGASQVPSGPPRSNLSKSDSSPKPASAHIGHTRTEVPTVPEQVYHAFERPTPDPLAIGNPAYELSLRLDGKLGHFLDRSATRPNPTHIPLYPTAYRAGVFYTLRDALRRNLRLKGYIEIAELEQRAQDTADSLANGVYIMTYLKLRSVNSLDIVQMDRFLKKPKVPILFEVPSPYALAISQLGVFKVSSLQTELTLSPTLPTGVTQNFGLPANQTWSSARYAQAVEYAKSLGMQFSTVDLNVKLGSSWWLYDQEVEDDIFTLKCILPEDNYTEATAIIHTLFCANQAGTLSNTFVDLTQIEQKDYGSMLRNPHPDINVSTYYAVEEASETIWKVV